MSVVIYLLKIVSFAFFAWRVLVLVKLKKEDPSTKIMLDLFSMIEHAAGIGVALIGWMAVVTPETYAFTAGLNLLGAVLMLTHNYRLIVGGEKKILFLMKIHELKKIKGIRAGRVTLHIFMKDGTRHSIIAPLTQNTVLRRMNYLK